jgi:hypothetical protein
VSAVGWDEVKLVIDTIESSYRFQQNSACAMYHEFKGFKKYPIILERKTMKKTICVILVLLVALSSAACAVPAFTGSPTDSSPEEATKSIPDGLSGYPFKLGDTTYALWRAVCSTGSDGSAYYEIQVLQKGQSMPITFEMGNDGKMHPNCSVGMRLVMPDGSTLNSGEVSFFATEEVAGFNAVSCYGFTLPSGQSLPDTAVFFRSDANAEIELDLSRLILVDAEQETEPTAAPEPSSPSAPENRVPEELIGSWEGAGEPVGGGTPLSLKITINADGAGSYVFEQAGYTESYPITMAGTDKTFAVDIPADNTLGITQSGGTYTFEDGVLTLHIITEFSSGRQFKYIVSCEKTG